jgi:Nuclease A inhibitor-like protein
MSQAETSPDSELPLAESTASESTASESAAVDALKAIVEGLTWMSESDYPFEVSQLPDRFSPAASPPAIANILSLTKHAAETPVEVMSVQDFFAPAIQAQDWHEAADQQRVERFVTLLQWIEQQLSDAMVYRIGTVEVDIYIIGRARSGAWISLATKAIET